MSSSKRHKATCALFKSVHPAFALFGIAMLATACSDPQSGKPFDVGSMAYSDPLHTGIFKTTFVDETEPHDTGSEAHPAPRPQGGFTTPHGPQPRDAVSMAYPVPLSSGLFGTIPTEPQH